MKIERQFNKSGRGVFLITSLLALLAASLLLAGCSEKTAVEPQLRGKVMGRVFFQDTDGTIPKVVVSIGNKEYKTVTDGKFVLRDIPYGTHTITAAKGGYSTHVSEVVVDAPEVEHNIDLWYLPDDDPAST